MPGTASLNLDSERVTGEISPLLFGGFAEHMGRCVYGGIYDPASPLADEYGLRRDVLDALREVGYTVIRYPGGNFVSGYRWQDGVGPRESRPRRRELAWRSIETNQFGTDEFMRFCREVAAEPMLAVNLGTGTAEEAAQLVEYCNAPAGTHYADWRVANGHREPYGVRYWCLGNEMDGPWQIGALDAHAYGLKALEAAKLMRLQDPQAKLVLCGSSHPRMPTFPEWDRIALETCWEKVDYHAMHCYAENFSGDSASFLGYGVQFEEQLRTVAATLQFVKAKRRSKHDVFLSWDEWNVWYKDTSGDGGWQEAPRLSEEVYNLEDALVVAQWLSVFLRNADVLRIACLAQIVNTISPITTTPTGLLKHSTYYPLVLFSRNARGLALAPLVKSPTYHCERFGEVPLLDASASLDEAAGKGAVFLVNRSLTDGLAVDVVWQGRQPRSVEAVWQLSGTDPKASNSLERPQAVAPRAVTPPSLEGNRASLTLPPLSFTTLLLSY